MRHVRMSIGLVAVVAFAVALNLAVFRQDFFSAAVLVPFGLALAAGLVWLALELGAVSRQSRYEGQSLYGLSNVVASVVFLGICMVVYAFAQHWDRSWDLTQEGRRELARQTVHVLEAMDKEVQVICFFLQVDDHLVRIARDKTERFLERCRTYTPLLEVEFLDPQIARVRMEGLGITHASTQGTVVLRCGKRQRVITLSGGSPRLEERDFTNGLVNVLRDAEPKVCFLTGHGERDILDGDEKEGATVLKKLLEGESYKTERIAIRLTAPEIPQDCSVLVINGLGLHGPTADLHPDEIHAIEEYMDRGGRLVVFLDPWVWRAHDEQAGQLLPWLAARYGIEVGADVLVSPESQWTLELSADPAPFDQDPTQSAFRGCFNNTHPITRGFDQRMLLRVARTVRATRERPEGVICTELLRTTPDFWAESDVELLFETGKARREPDEPEGPLSVAIAATVRTESAAVEGGPARDARVVVVGDSDFAANGQISVIPGNLNIVLNIMAWLTENEELIAIRPTDKTDPPIILSAKEERTIVWIAVLGTLQAIVAAGLGVHVYRRRRQ
ncbi:MAG TPA: hypothetical protein ENN80_04815 [Candidatus Hydrogenedentes bacterium]|nr:hypothetical protein [Candidatus Hydrogenedentota bacterium]